MNTDTKTIWHPQHKELRIFKVLDTSRPCQTMEGHAAQFMFTEVHPTYPHSFRIPALDMSISVTRFGEHISGKWSHLNIQNAPLEMKCPDCHGRGTGRSGECTGCGGEGVVFA